jgi:hypothetical protein
MKDKEVTHYRGHMDDAIKQQHKDNQELNKEIDKAMKEKLKREVVETTLRKQLIEEIESLGIKVDHEEECVCVDCEAEMAKHFKLHITKEQWEELSDEQKLAFSLDREIHVQTWAGGEHGFVGEVRVEITIGQMIEFLGDDWYKDIFAGDETFEVYYIGGCELADALWFACKQKLSTQNS